ncbi:MAG: hypothetical protein PHV03_06130 [Desulfitobacteriaceae bacterium]|nr:hypothetical protein [Desulfitobacteriaceae bacterium]
MDCRQFCAIGRIGGDAPVFEAVIAYIFRITFIKFQFYKQTILIVEWPQNQLLSCDVGELGRVYYLNIGYVAYVDASTTAAACAVSLTLSVNSSSGRKYDQDQDQEKEKYRENLLHIFSFLLSEINPSPAGFSNQILPQGIKGVITLTSPSEIIRRTASSL